MCLRRSTRRQKRPRSKRTENAALLREAEEGLPLLQPSWLARVKTANSNLRLANLEDAFSKAPIDRAKKAARGQYLVAALDEGGEFLAFDGDRATTFAWRSSISLRRT
jgi:hypothetical protein